MVTSSIDHDLCIAEAVLSRPVSPVLLDDKGRMINARLSSKGEWCIPIPLNKMGRWLPKVLVAVEDKRFYDHAPLTADYDWTL